MEALSGGASLQDLINMPVREQIGRFKYVQLHLRSFVGRLRNSE